MKAPNDLDDVPVVADMLGEDEPAAGVTAIADRDWLFWLNESIGLLVRLGVIGGLAFTAVQFTHSLSRERTQRSFELVDLWESDRIQSANSVIEAKLNSLQQSAKDIFGEEMVGNEAEFAEKLIGSQLLGDAKVDAELSTAFSTTVYFLNRVSYCASSELCDKGVLDAYFKDYSRQFWVYFGEELKRTTENKVHPIEVYLNE
jgi:hypothetical protein